MSSGSERRDALEQVLTLSRELLQRAKAGEWLELPELETERRQRLETFFSVPIGEAEAEFVRHKIEEIMAFDRELLALTKTERKSVLHESKKFREGRKAQDAYAKFG